MIPAFLEEEEEPGQERDGGMARRCIQAVELVPDRVDTDRRRRGVALLLLLASLLSMLAARVSLEVHRAHAGL